MGQGYRGALHDPRCAHRPSTARPHSPRSMWKGFEAAVLAGLSQPLPALSFEFTTIQRDVALACLDRLASLGPYAFDVALGESQALTFNRWISKADMAAHLAGLPHEANSGDVYCVLQTLTALRPSGPAIGGGVLRRWRASVGAIPLTPIPPYRVAGSCAMLGDRLSSISGGTGHRRRTPRRRGDERQRAGAVRREGQRHASISPPRMCAASASRRRTPPTSARCSATASRPTGPAARRRAIRRPLPPRATAAAQAHDALRADRFLGGRPDLAKLLAPRHRHRAHRQPRREGAASPAGVDDPADGRRGGAGALPAGRLLAPAPAGTGRPGAHRVRVVVPGRAGRGRGAADRQDQGGRLRSQDAHLHAGLRARRHGDREDGERRSEPAHRWRSPSTRPSTAAPSRRCAPCT